MENIEAKTKIIARYGLTFIGWIVCCVIWLKGDNVPGLLQAAIYSMTADIFGFSGAAKNSIKYMAKKRQEITENEV